MDATAQIVAWCTSILPAYDGRVPGPGQPGSPTGSHIIVYGGSTTPVARCLSDHATVTLTVWRIVAVSNNPVGCRRITTLLRQVLDGAALGTVLLHVVAVSDPQEDRDDPSEYRWTSTTELHLTAPASRAASGATADTAYADLIP